MKKLGFFILGMLLTVCVNAQSVSYSRATISPASLATVEENGEGLASFQFVESSGQEVLATVEGNPNVVLTLNLHYIALKDFDANLIEGEVLEYFDVNYDSDLHVVTFEQKRNIPGFWAGTATLPIKVTQDSSQAEALNGFYAELEANDENTNSQGHASIFTFTQRGSEGGNDSAGAEETGAEQEEILETVTEEVLPSLEVFPNPVNDIVNIQLVNDGIKKVELFDLVGKRILTKEYNGVDTLELNINSLATSVYVLKVHTETKTKSLKLFKN